MAARSSDTPRLRAQLAIGFLAALERLGGAVLQLGGEIVVEAFDRGELIELDIGDFLERAEPLGDQQLRERLVDVQLVLEQLGPLDELALALLRGIGPRWRMSIALLVSWLARRTFCPRRPIARLS